MWSSQRKSFLADGIQSTETWTRRVHSWQSMAGTTLRGARTSMRLLLAKFGSGVGLPRRLRLELSLQGILALAWVVVLRGTAACSWRGVMMECLGRLLPNSQIPTQSRCEQQEGFPPQPTPPLPPPHHSASPLAVYRDVLA